MSKLTDRQQLILEFIRSEVERKGYPPSVREIGEAVGLQSSSTVHGHLQRLEELGYIRRDPAKPRAIEVLNSESGASRASGARAGGRSSYRWYAHPGRGKHRRILPNPQ